MDKRQEKIARKCGACGQIFFNQRDFDNHFSGSCIKR
jgi:uncharacterized C2H2 Zn-finger protein